MTTATPLVPDWSGTTQQATPDGENATQTQRPTSDRMQRSTSSPDNPLLTSVTTEVNNASGDLSPVPGESDPVGSGPQQRYLVEVEDGLPGAAGDFARAVQEILGDERSWIGGGDLSLKRVDEEPVDFRVTLASPETTDELCAPLRTNGELSCHQGGRAVINQNRWVSGVDHFDDDLEEYRIYVVNHEVGHALGHGHVDCPEQGEPAPVMQQQTLGLQGCEPNGWVHP
ncbi:DUF3152 domain-containing protein [Lipingzhangella sp. LS1_29]|uniref:DUF3152 domain-containing protein n=1 Tax=Lipingzhangella rawalii TaxID=2055835 RepID=A0ABU2HAZ5_9ACTN|nr:DUF3152 domain-containing protein [Lipingzhangella rawalii]MDS1272000.1 DUF3152 domain-containing protein [Lipingzhangella rawalii]